MTPRRPDKYNIELRYFYAGFDTAVFKYTKIASPDAFSAAARVLLEHKDDLPDQTRLQWFSSKVDWPYEL